MWLTLLIFAAACGAAAYLLYQQFLAPKEGFSLEAELPKIAVAFFAGALIVLILKMLE
jgi:hypothetical protein